MRATMAGLVTVMPVAMQATSSKAEKICMSFAPNGTGGQSGRPQGSDELDLVGDDFGVVVGAPVLLVAGVADLAVDNQLVALLLVVGDRLAQAIEGFDGVELVVSLGVAVIPPEMTARFLPTG